MSTTLEVIRKAEGKGIVFSIIDGVLDLAFPEGTKTDRLIDWIKANKTEILAIIVDKYRDGLGVKWAIVNSRVLGEEIVIAKDGSTVPPSASEGRCVYFDGELRALIEENATEGHLRHIHEAKMVFGGTIEQQ